MCLSETSKAASDRERGRQIETLNYFRRGGKELKNRSFSYAKVGTFLFQIQIRSKFSDSWFNLNNFDRIESYRRPLVTKTRAPEHQNESLELETEKKRADRHAASWDRFLSATQLNSTQLIWRNVSSSITLNNPSRSLESLERGNLTGFGNQLLEATNNHRQRNVTQYRTNEWLSQIFALVSTHFVQNIHHQQ